VVQNLLSFARQRKPHKQEVDLRTVLDETLALRDYDIKVNNIKVEREIESTLPAVTGDAHQLEQVFLNIVNNAVDAMLEIGRGGTLRLRAYSREGYVITEFEDSGTGIKEPNRIFEPFYTTKSVGKGTGLGLSICYGIIKEHGGDIAARNAARGGAIIEVRLPSAGQIASSVPTSPALRRESALAGRILLIEDEEAVLEFERDVLSGAGAEVTTRMNAEEAKALLLSQTFDAVIINGKMPGSWNATDFHHWIEQNRPELQKHLLFTFSSLAEPDLRRFLQEKSLPHLVKPFEVTDLINHARRLLVKTLAATAN
jgi:two-component system NtrC family sensor kinase